MHDLIYITVFKKVADHKNFTLAARELGLTPSAASRQVSRLEDKLGAQLLIRTTRNIRLTEAGKLFYEKCARSLAELEEASRSISHLSDRPHGQLSVVAPPCFGRLHVAAAIPDFLRLYPEVGIEISLGYPEANIIGNSADILICSPTVQGKSLKFHTLAQLRSMICATPEYLARCGLPTDPRELKDRNCLVLVRPQLAQEWRFSGPNGSLRVKVGGNLRSNSIEAIYDAVLHGTGIARLPNYIVGPDLRSGRLVLIFPSPSKKTGPWSVSVSPNTMKAYYMRSKFTNLTLQAFLDFLTARFKANYDWERRPNSF